MPTITDEPKIPVSSRDPFDLNILRNPHEFHRELRDAAPIVHLPAYDVYAMGRYEEVHQALTDWQSFQSAAGVGLSNWRYEKPFRPPSLLLEADPPKHDSPRRVVEGILGPRSLRRLRAAWFADAEMLVDEVLSEGHEFDAVTHLSEAFPLRVFPDAVGLPAEGRRENLLPYGDHIFNVVGPNNSLVQSGANDFPGYAAWAEERCRREVLSPNGFGAQIWAAADRGDILPSQAPLLVRSLLSAGVDTTIAGISAMMYALASHPDQWRKLRDDPGLVRPAFDEAVRWHSPVQIFFRTATRDIHRGDVTIPDGRKILMFLGSANRDPRRWSDPDRFDLERDPSGHVGFGMGIHQCVGQHIARLEAEALFTALLKRVRTIELTGEPVIHVNNTLRGIASLPVRLQIA
ncbi:cytochrome P450 [Nocardia sp. R7R-8]|uniref:cytochrome P450 n=1 Tax=Nocardia sp. R7R-8 TaxID=3459304 RepID=UPI00403D68B0